MVLGMWRKFLSMACIAMVLGLLMTPVLAYHPHQQAHGPQEHHGESRPDSSKDLGAVLQQLCESIDGCHATLSILAAPWIELRPIAQAAHIPLVDDDFASAYVALPFRPPAAVRR